MKEHDKMKLWEDLSPEEKAPYYYNENNILSRLAPLLRANPVVSKEKMDEHFKQTMLLATDKAFLKKMEEVRAKKYYYLSWNKTEVEVFYDAYFDGLLSSIDHTQELAYLSAEAKIRVGGDKLEYIKYLEGELKKKQAFILRRHKQLGLEWYQKDMPDIDKKDVLFGLFDIENLELFRYFVSDLMFIKRVKDLIEEVQYALVGKESIQAYSEHNKRRDEDRDKRKESDIVEWFYKCFASYIEEPHITYFQQILFRFLRTGIVPESVSEIRIDEKIKREDVDSFMWYVWYLWNEKKISREQCASFLLKIFPKLYRYWNRNQYIPLEVVTIKKHWKDNGGEFIKLPEQFK